MNCAVVGVGGLYIYFITLCVCLSLPQRHLLVPRGKQRRKKSFLCALQLSSIARGAQQAHTLEETSELLKARQSCRSGIANERGKINKVILK